MGGAGGYTMKIQNHLPRTPSIFHQIFNYLLHRLSQGLVDARERQTSEVCERGMIGTSAERQQGMMERKREKQLIRVSD